MSNFEYLEGFLGNDCYQDWVAVRNKTAFDANLSQHRQSLFSIMKEFVFLIKSRPLIIKTSEVSDCADMES